MFDPLAFLWWPKLFSGETPWSRILPWSCCGYSCWYPTTAQVWQEKNSWNPASPGFNHKWLPLHQTLLLCWLRRLFSGTNKKESSHGCLFLSLLISASDVFLGSCKNLLFPDVRCLLSAKFEIERSKNLGSSVASLCQKLGFIQGRNRRGLTANQKKPSKLEMQELHPKSCRRGIFFALKDFTCMKGTYQRFASSGLFGWQKRL